MKSKSLIKILSMLMALVLAVSAFTACNNKVDDNHTHTYSSEWSKDDNSHWHAATCEHKTEKKDVEEHKWNEGKVTTEATETKKGVRTFTCTVCSKTKTEDIPMLEKDHKHTFESSWTSDKNYHWHAATCGHSKEEADVALHIFDDENDVNCNVCGYERVSKENGVTFNVSARTYDKTEQGLTAAEYTVKGGTVSSVEYKVKGASDDTYSEAAPVNAGEYTVRIKVAGNAVYGDAVATTDLIIGKRELFYGQTYSAEKPIKYTEGFTTSVGTTYFNRGYKDTNKIDGDEIEIAIKFAAKEAGAELVSFEMYGKDSGNYFLSDAVKPELT